MNDLSWVYLAYVLVGLMVLAVVPALAAVPFWLAGRPYPARVLLATALLCEAIVWAAVFFLLARGADLRHGNNAKLAFALMGLSLLIAGAAQFVAALRGPRTFAVALAFAAGAVAFIVADTPLGYYILRWVDVPQAWLDVFLLDWTSLAVALLSLALAGVSLMVAVLLPSGSRRPGADGAETKGPGRTSR